MRLWSDRRHRALCAAVHASALAAVRTHGPCGDAEDVASDAVMRLMSAHDPDLIEGGIEGAKKLAYTVATNGAMNARRKNTRREALGETRGDEAFTVALAVASATGVHDADEGVGADETVLDASDGVATDAVADAFDNAVRHASYIAAHLANRTAPMLRDWANFVRSSGGRPAPEIMAELAWLERVHRAFSMQPDSVADEVRVGASICYALRSRSSRPTKRRAGVSLERWVRICVGTDYTSAVLLPLSRVDRARLESLAARTPLAPRPLAVPRGRPKKTAGQSGYFADVAMLAGALLGQPVTGDRVPMIANRIRDALR